jgi:hypothetical protein
MSKSAYFRHVFANNFFWCIFNKLYQRIRNILKYIRNAWCLTGTVKFSAMPRSCPNSLFGTFISGCYCWLALWGNGNTWVLSKRRIVSVCRWTYGGQRRYFSSRFVPGIELAPRRCNQAIPICQACLNIHYVWYPKFILYLRSNSSHFLTW